jgi:hypothetical protein
MWIMRFPCWLAVFHNCNSPRDHFLHNFMGVTIARDQPTTELAIDESIG